MIHALRLTLFLCLATGLSGTAWADGPQSSARIPVRILEGRLVARVDLSTPVRRIPVHLFVDYESSYGLEVHARALSPLRINDGHALTLHFPGLAITRDKWALGDPVMYERFTRRYARELNETAVVGSIGAGLLGRFHLVFDVGRGFLEIAPAHPARTEEKPAAPPPGTIALDVDVRRGIVWLPVRYGGDQGGVFGLATTTYDTRVARALCRRLGKPAGDIGTLDCGGFDLARYVALRPARILERHEDGIVGMTGINLLEHFRIDVDRVNRRVLLRETRKAEFPQADLDYFRALAAGGAAPIEAWLKQHHETRLAPEASDTLLRRLLEAAAIAPKRMEQALTWNVRTRAKDLRTSHALVLMKQLEEYGESGLVVRAGELGLETARDDRDPTAAHKIHAILGEIHLEAGETDEAWRHLLSAAFGLADIGPNARPEEGRGDAARVQLNLGRLYEKQKRYARAFSRYVQAVTYPETGTEALAGLLRVNSRIADADRMSSELVERLVAGKVPAYSTADRFEPDKKTPARRCVLMEVFTGANLGRAIASDLATDALRDYFGAEHLAIVRYHPALAGVTPLVSRAADNRALLAEVDRAPFALFDGVVRTPCGGAERFKQRHFSAFRARVLGRLRQASAHTIEINAHVADGKVTGTVTIKGPAAWATVEVILVEKGVVFPGTNRIVVHHDVARAVLADGIAYEPVEGGMKVSFVGDFERVRKQANAHLDSLRKRGAGMVAMRAPPVDPEQIVLVAVLRDATTGAVLQAAQAEPTHPEEQ